MADSLKTPHKIAEALFQVIPAMWHAIRLYMREAGEEETTMMQVSVLFHIQEHPVTASDLAKKRNVSLQAASTLVQGLVERGWVTRVADPNDRRRFLLQITPDGLERAESTRKQMIDYLTVSLSELNESEITAAGVFLPALERVVMRQMMPDAVGEPNDG